ncbi:hypothetical protein LEP1GSC043_0071 [Leptospira weilii str. Ecochallenge]|uniref:Uncharacterized protein n=2 Tax=Leptospira weilii TaxID=28184 RepID=N1UF49_9LEPT|nr:hypothetical protein LEP1GSC051_3347 [Leptospira sp. P2653]EMN92413.1 hypothetical protein LEP1GSC108_0138 [Leptospira weilii str. UI 13098]EMY14655.1 hypothetical protein LEP1GSC043_0071 [Leptospira weilii str. Ecochallenge]OMI16070.1 hypothetical protein BUQ74_17355 [Leptospira weilii serovar Heyan]
MFFDPTRSALNLAQKQISEVLFPKKFMLRVDLGILLKRNLKVHPSLYDSNQNRSFYRNS